MSDLDRSRAWLQAQANLGHEEAEIVLGALSAQSEIDAERSRPSLAAVEAAIAEAHGRLVDADAYLSGDERAKRVWFGLETAIDTVGIAATLAWTLGGQSMTAPSATFAHEHAQREVQRERERLRGMLPQSLLDPTDFDDVVRCFVADLRGKP